MTDDELELLTTILEWISQEMEISHHRTDIDRTEAYSTLSDEGGKMMELVRRFDGFEMPAEAEKEWVRSNQKQASYNREQQTGQPIDWDDAKEKARYGIK